MYLCGCGMTEVHILTNVGVTTILEVLQIWVLRMVCVISVGFLKTFRCLSNFELEVFCSRTRHSGGGFRTLWTVGSGLFSQ